MDDTAIGWIAAIIIGGLAGWLAEMFMKSNQGVMMNVILGIVGAALANFIMGLLGIALGGWVGYLVAGFIGACILIAIVRAVSGRARAEPVFEELYYLTSSWKAGSLSLRDLGSLRGLRPLPLAPAAGIFAKPSAHRLLTKQSVLHI